MPKSKSNSNAKNREKFYQWAIRILLCIVGFLSGLFFQTERLRSQVVTNTVEIRVMKEGFQKLDSKLDILLAGNQKSGD